MNLRAYLKASDLSISGFARLAGISRPTLRRVLEGRGGQKATLEAILVACNGAVSVEELLGIGRPPSPPDTTRRAA